MTVASSVILSLSALTEGSCDDTYYLQSYLNAPARSGALKFGVVSDPLSTTGLRRERYETGMSVLGSAGLQPAA